MKLKLKLIKKKIINNLKINKKKNLNVKTKKFKIFHS